MRKLASVCVFCGSRPGNDPAYAAEAELLGRALARAEVRLVFGGASIGIMGTIARAVLAHSGKVTGVIPHFLKEIEVPLEGVSERVLTKTMHERKQIMFDRSDAFVILPGGIGTLEETFEMLTWRQLNRHDKPIVIVDVNGYWTPLVELVEHSVERGFASASVLHLLQVVPTASEVLPAIERALAPAGPEIAAHLEEL
jgi:hypothetical protein